MTSGSFGGLIGPSSDYKTWSGSDGKYEITADLKRYKWNDYTCTYQSRTGSKSSIFGNYLPLTIDMGSPWTSSDDLVLQSKLVSAVREHDFDLGVAVAQGKLTVELVTTNLGKLGKAILFVKRGDIFNAARQLGCSPKTSRLKPSDISGRWLELQYGWLPLVDDCFNAAKAFEAITNGPRKTVVRVTRTRKDVAHDFVGINPPDVPHVCNRQHSKAILYELSEVLSGSRSLGLLDPLSVAWELIPYSFVVDWFIPIGSYLDNLNVIPNLKGRFLTTSFRRNVTQSSPITATPAFIGASVRQKLVEVSRVPSTGLTTSFPEFKPFVKAMSPRHIWNAISLAQQRFSSKDRIDYVTKPLIPPVPRIGDRFPRRRR